MKINMPVTDLEYTLTEHDSVVSKTDRKGMITYVNEDFLRIPRLNPAGEFLQAQTRRCFKAATAVDDAVTIVCRIPANGNGLLNAAALDRGLKFGEFRFVEQLAGLLGIGSDAVATDEV